MQHMEENTIRIVQEPKKAELVQACYGIIGAMIEVFNISVCFWEQSAFL